MDGLIDHQGARRHVIHLSAECYPVAKVGGLADVVGALPRYQQQAGVQAWVVIPWYNKPFVHQHDFETVYEGEFFQGSQPLQLQVIRERNRTLGFELYLLKIPGLLDRDEVYGYQDESEQFMAFQHGFLHWIIQAGISPDVVHCHDHHTGLTPFLMYHAPRFEALRGVVTVATVHNAQYQGWMDWNRAILLPPFDTWKWGLLDWDRCINPLATLIKCCHAFTAVSVGYLQELFREANGLEHLFAVEREKGLGIVNGIDTVVWDPAADPLLLARYEAATAGTGKNHNKKHLYQQFGLSDTKRPLLAFIGRFALEKGADLLPAVVEQLCHRFPDQLNILILGSGDSDVQQAIQALAARYGGQVAAYIGYHEELAHRIYAGADFLIMPSRVEPCGLNQLYAMRYGTLPVVRATGGLKDTVIDLQQPEGYGITFADVTPEAVVAAVERACAVYGEKPLLRKLRKRMMELDFSWDQSAAAYLALYNKLLQKPTT